MYRNLDLTCICVYIFWLRNPYKIWIILKKIANKQFQTLWQYFVFETYYLGGHPLHEKYNYFRMYVHTMTKTDNSSLYLIKKFVRFICNFCKYTHIHEKKKHSIIQRLKYSRNIVGEIFGIRLIFYYPSRTRLRLSCQKMYYSCYILASFPSYHRLILMNVKGWTGTGRWSLVSYTDNCFFLH